MALAAKRVKDNLDRLCFRRRFECCQNIYRGCDIDPFFRSPTGAIECHVVDHFEDDRTPQSPLQFSESVVCITRGVVSRLLLALAHKRLRLAPPGEEPLEKDYARVGDDRQDEQRQSDNLSILVSVKHTQLRVSISSRHLADQETDDLIRRACSFPKVLATQRRMLPSGFFILSAFRLYKYFLFAA